MFKTIAFEQKKQKSLYYISANLSRPMISDAQKLSHVLHLPAFLAIKRGYGSPRTTVELRYGGHSSMWNSLPLGTAKLTTVFRVCGKPL